MKTPQEYREKLKIETTRKLPSGLEVQIQAVPTLVILELTAKADESGMELDKYMARKLTETLNLVIPSSVLHPKILPIREPGQETMDDALYIDELVIGDLTFLFTEIVKLSGISEKEIESYQTFLKQRDREVDSTDSEDLRL